MGGDDRDWKRVAWVYWLLPASFVVHDGEELLTMPRWIARHREELAGLAGKVGLGQDVLESLPTTTAAAAGAIGAVFLVFLVVTLGATLNRGRGTWQYVYAGLLGVFFLHAFTHVAQSVYFGGYTPGVIGAVAAVIPASCYVYARLFRASLLSARVAVVTALIGVAMFVPGLLLAQSLGHWLASK